MVVPVDLQAMVSLRTRSRISSPGGTCDFDLPAYSASQQHAPALVVDDTGRTLGISNLALVAAVLTAVVLLVRRPGERLLSGSIVGDRMWKVLEQGTDENGPIGHGWTYSSHPLCAAAGVANLELVDSLSMLVPDSRETLGFGLIRR